VKMCKKKSKKDGGQNKFNFSNSCTKDKESTGNRFYSGNSFTRQILHHEHILTKCMAIKPRII
jgi:hypothetical protein